MKLLKLGKLFLFLILTYAMLMSVNIPRTATIDTTTLSGIRDACDPALYTDELIYDYWINNSQTAALATRDEIQTEFKKYSFS